MKKSTFINLIVGTIGGLLFSLGMCMCLLPQWNAFQLGVVCAAIGAVSLLVQGAVAWVHSGRKVKMHWKTFGKVLYGVFASLVLGAGMCMIMIWNLMLPGILVGIVGIVLLLTLIPMCIGLAGVAATYPIYQYVVKLEREKIGPEILRLSTELLNG